MTKRTPISRSGRFAGAPESEVAEFTESVSFDARLWRQDITGSLAHASMLQKIGILNQSEYDAIRQGLEQIREEIASGQFHWDPALEDVHMNIEAELTRRVPAGAKLHTGRSRNDQIALDMRLWMRETAGELRSELVDLQGSLVGLAARHPELIIPGYTHLQRAQPVYFAHHLLAYVEMIARDEERFAQCAERANVCPLGSGALAGSTLPLDRAFAAEQLGFVDANGAVRLSQNSMDAVSDRDFVVEFCGASALVAMHLSRLAEDIILWASSEFGFIKLPDSHTTGSSLMPQKKNPDIAELVRGKTGRIYGNLTAVLTLLKGLPMTYNRDLQEDKEPLFDTADTVRRCVRLTARMLSRAEMNLDKCRNAANDPALLATDLADYLVRKGVPFREAHHVVGAVVALGEKLQKPLDRLTLAELRSADTRFHDDALESFVLDRALNQRRLPGSPGTEEVRRQLERWKEALGL